MSNTPSVRTAVFRTDAVPQVDFCYWRHYETYVENAVVMIDGLPHVLDTLQKISGRGWLHRPQNVFPKRFDKEVSNQMYEPPFSMMLRHRKDLEQLNRINAHRR